MRGLGHEPLWFSKLGVWGSHLSTLCLQSWDAQCLMLQVEAPGFEFPPIYGTHTRGAVYSEPLFQPLLPAPIWFSSSLLNVDQKKKSINILHYEGLENDNFLNKMAVLIRGELEKSKLTYWREGLSERRHFLTLGQQWVLKWEDGPNKRWECFINFSISHFPK